MININAVFARYPDPAFLASSVNRASCLSLAKALSIELGHEGILVNSVNIGFVTTPQWENIHRRRAPDIPAEQFFAQLVGDEVPLGGSGGPMKLPAWSRFWRATGRATSQARRSTWPGAWGSSCRGVADTMCRLLGYCARARASLADLMTEPGLRHFSALSRWHGDGWGIAWYDDQQLHVEKSPGRAIDEPAYDKLTHCALGDAGLVHLRMATPRAAGRGPQHPPVHPRRFRARAQRRDPPAGPAG